MRFEYISPFVSSAQDVIEDLIPSIFQNSKITLEESLIAKGLSATIILKGNIEGHIVLDLNPELAKKIAGAMNGSEFSKLDDLAIDTICELTNIIIGKAISSLNNSGFRIKPSTPLYFIGEKTFHGLECVSMALSTHWGEIKIMAAVHEIEASLN